MNIVFMGTPDFAVATLRALHQAGHTIALVVTQPDRPKGRGREIQPSPVKICAGELGLAVAQPDNVNTPDFARRLRDLAPDAVVVVAFGQILKPELLVAPRHGCLNLHASLLPKYRGAAPIHWAVIRGETETGVTAMKMDVGMDTGDILLTRKIPIRPQDTTQTLHDALARIGAELMVETLARLASGNLTPTPQDNTRATYAPKLKKEDGLVSWDKSADEINNQVRGLSPWPGAYAFLNGRRLGIRAVEATPGTTETAPGVVCNVTPAGIQVAVRGGFVTITELQPEGKKPMPADRFIQGHSIRPGDRFQSPDPFTLTNPITH
jgi:methionyl-tRNA formyltransferase